MVHLDYLRVLDDGDGLFGGLSVGLTKVITVRHLSRECVGDAWFDTGYRVCRVITWTPSFGPLVRDTRSPSNCTFAVNLNEGAPAIPSESIVLNTDLPERLDEGWCAIAVRDQDELHVELELVDSDFWSGDESCGEWLDVGYKRPLRHTYHREDDWGAASPHLMECRDGVKADLHYRIFRLSR